MKLIFPILLVVNENIINGELSDTYWRDPSETDASDGRPQHALL